ncbi:MAG: hypothetical protein IKQ06_04940 [Bacilli bacterium]|nr:hypothetical protein [Bacilli bacterium]MBR6137482.1 hypothetical protein [Bacilli bacterium]
MEEIDLKEMFDYFLGRVSWIIIAVALAVAVGNVYTMFTRVPMYRSTTTLVLVSENKDSASYNTSEQQLNKNLVGTYSEIIKSRTILNAVIRNLDLDYSYTTLQNRITVSSVNNTEIIRIAVADSDPKVATKIANEIAKVFVSEINKFYKLNNVSVLDRAENNSVPYNVNYLKDNAIYIMIGLVLSCGIIFIFFYFDTTIKTSEEIEKKLGLTVVGIVPKVGKE